MLTGDSMDVEEAYRLGMVTQDLPGRRARRQDLEFARRIAQLPTMTRC